MMGFSTMSPYGGSSGYGLADPSTALGMFPGGFSPSGLMPQMQSPGSIFGANTIDPNSIHHDNGWMGDLGKGIGGAIGLWFGAPGMGIQAGGDAGYALGDLFGGDWDNLGKDLLLSLNGPGSIGGGMFGGPGESLTGNASGDSLASLGANSLLSNLLDFL